MRQYATFITKRAITSPGVIVADCFAPDGVDADTAQNWTLYGVRLQVPDTVSQDFDIDIRWQGGTIFVGDPPTFAASSSTTFIMSDIDAPDVAAPVEVALFEVISLHALTVPAGGIPAGMNIVIVYDDGEAGGGGGGVTDHGALTGLGDDDHPQYLRQAEADALYAPIGGGGGGTSVPINWRGAWSAATAYSVGDGVAYNGSSYAALVANTNVAPNSDPTKWQLIAQKGADGVQGAAGAQGTVGAQGPAGVAGAAGAAGQGFTWRGAWSNATAYAAYDTVSYGGSSYVAIAGSTNVVPGTDATKWNPLAAKGDTGAAGGGGGGGFTSKTHITGFEYRRIGGTFDETIEIDPGSAYVPGAGAGEIVELTAAVTRSPVDSSANWEYIYLFKNGSGNGDIEISNVAPTFYNGDAQVKTGDTSRRFVGAYYRDGSIGVHSFHSQASGSRTTITWRRTLYSTPYLFLNGANAIGADTQVTPPHSGGGGTFMIPPFTALMHMIARLTVNANSRSFFGFSQLPNDVGDTNPWGAEVLLENDNQTGSVVEKMHQIELRMDKGRQSFYYYIQQFSGGGPAVTLHLRGFTFRR